MDGLFNDDLEEPLYLGLDDEVIENLAIGNIKNRRDMEIGKAIEVTLELKRIIVTEAQTIQGTGKQKLKLREKLQHKKQGPLPARKSRVLQKQVPHDSIFTYSF